MPPRKVRSDIKIGNLEKRLGLDKGAIRNPDGTDARSDKKLGTLRAEYQRVYGGPTVRAGSTGLPKKATTSTSAKQTAAPKTAVAPKRATVAKTTAVPKKVAAPKAAAAPKKATATARKPTSNKK